MPPDTPARRPRSLTRQLQQRNRELLDAFGGASPAPEGTVCMFVRNTFEHDARVIREIEALTDEGLAVVVVAAAPTIDAVGVVEEDRYTLVRVFHQATGVRVLLDWLLEGQRAYWRGSRRVWRTAKWPFRATGLFLGNKVARRLVLSRTTRVSASRRRQLAAKVRVVSRASLRVAALRSGRPPMGIAVIKRVRKRTQLVLWPLHRFLAAVSFVRLCARVGASLQPDAYHCHDQNTVLAGQLARRRSPARLIYDAHELYPHRNRPHPRWWKPGLFEIGDRFSSRRSDAVITVNQSIAEHMERRYGIDRVDVVMNIPDVQSGASDGADVLDIRHIPSPRLFYCGNVTFNRGLEESVRALVHLPEAALVVVGQARGGYDDELRALAASLGVGDRVHIFPPVRHEHVVRVAAQADVGLVMIKPSCLSYEYALPNKLFECLHAGLPVVASDLPELRRIVHDDGVGLVCDHDDPRSIAEAVATIVGTPELAEKMRRCAVEAAQSYTWARERGHLLAVYRRLDLLPGDGDGVQDQRGIRLVPAPPGAPPSVMPAHVEPTDVVVEIPEPEPEPEPEPTLAEPPEPPKRRPTLAERAVLREESRSELHAAVTGRLEPGARVAVVSRGDDELLALGGYSLGHFPQAVDGEWAGYHPADDEEAIAELAAVQSRGFQYLAFPSTSQWWLDHYVGLRSVLEQDAERVHASSGCTIFRLGAVARPTPEPEAVSAPPT